MNARPPAAEISHFVLFGEQAGDDDPEFIHICSPSAPMGRIEVIA